MTFQVRLEHRHNAMNGDDRIFVLDDGAGSFAEVAAGLGFNCYRWHVPAGEVLWADPNFFTENRPTRSGFPILFPFPNRIRDGRFAWDGKEYRLPMNDSSGQNAIHGFACRNPWQRVSTGSDDTAAWVTGTFTGSKDAPESVELWPTDYQIAITYRLAKDRLEVRADIENPDKRPMPFGLGYHPYFAVVPFGGADAIVTAHAGELWELADSLPTGRRVPLDAPRDLRSGRRFADLQLDDVYGGILTEGARRESILLGSVAGAGRRLDIHMSPIFHDLVMFTPPHRQAVCLEPYTCITDAVNLQQRGVDAGWQVLPPGKKVSSVVQLIYR